MNSEGILPSFVAFAMRYWVQGTTWQCTIGLFHSDLVMLCWNNTDSLLIRSVEEGYEQES